MSSLFFSVVIPTYNRLARLKRCMDSIQNQTLDHSMFEVIIVDDGSIENISEQIFREDNSFLLKTIRIPHGGPSLARNTGVQKAGCDYIVFFEDDIIVDSKYLEKAHEIIRGHNYDVLEGRTLIEGGKDEIRIYDEKNTFSFIPCNIIIRRSLFVSVGGYDPQFFDSSTGLYFREDAELGFRLLDKGISIVKSDELVVEHPEQFETLSACLKHAKRYYFDPLLYKKHPKRYRQFIEKKKMMGIVIKRPLHKLSTGMLVAVIFIILGVMNGNAVLLLTGIACMLLIADILQYKYQHNLFVGIRTILNLGVFCVLPFIYWKYFIKGCIKYRSYRCIV